MNMLHGKAKATRVWGKQMIVTYLLSEHFQQEQTLHNDSMGLYG